MAGPGGVQAGRLAVRVLPDTTAFARSLLRYLDRIEARTVLRLGTDLDGAALVEQARQVAAAAQRAAAVRLPVGIDADGVVRQARQVATVAERAAPVRLRVDLDVDKLAAGAARLASMAATGARLGLVAASLAGAVVQAANLAAALAPAAGALAAIPALMVGAVAAAGVLRLAFAGVGEAIQGKPEALARLAPAARTVVDELRAAAPAADALRRTVQGAVFGPLIGEASALAGTWLPLLTARLSGIGAQFGALFAQMAAGARTPQFIAGIDAALRSTGAGIGALRSAAVPAMQALGAVIGAFAPMLAGAGTGLAGLGREFSAFILAAQQSGQLAEFVTAVAGTLRSIGGILVQLGGIIAAVMSAANTAGGGLLGNLEQILTAVNAFLSAGEGRTALQALFASVSQVIGALLPILADLVGALGPGIAALLGPSGLAGALKALAPAAKPVGAALSALAAAAAPLLPLLGSLLANALTVAAGMVQVLAAEFGPIIAVVAQVGTALAQQLLPVLTTLISNGLPAAVALGTALANALAPLVPVIVEMASTFLSVLLPALTEVQATLNGALLPVITQAAASIGGALLDALRQLAPHIPALARALAGLALAWVQIVTAMLPLVPLLVQVVTWLIGNNTLGPALQVVTVLARVLAATLGVVAEALRVAVGWLSTTAGWATRTGAAIGSGFGAALRVIATLPEQIRRVFTGASSWLVGAGRAIVDGLLSGIRQMAARAIQAARDVASSMLNAAKNVLGIRSPSRAFEQIGAQTVAGFVAGIDQARPAASRAMAAVLTPPAAGPFGIAAAGLSGPTDLRDPVVNLTALVRVGDGPVIDAVESAVSSDPERFAQHIRAGERGLTRRG
ncbi:MAG TPA: hypothetical protein VF755_01025 [Catenuloplanes sp.]